MKNKKAKEPEGPKQGDVTVTIVLGGGVVRTFHGNMNEYKITREALPLRYNTFRLSMTLYDIGLAEVVAPKRKSDDGGLGRD